MQHELPPLTVVSAPTEAFAIRCHRVGDDRHCIQAKLSIYGWLLLLKRTLRMRFPQPTSIHIAAVGKDNT
jgi:hypothetical protein